MIIETPDPKIQLEFLTRAISEWKWAIFPLNKIKRNWRGDRVWCACFRGLTCPNPGKCPRVKWGDRETHCTVMMLHAWSAMGFTGFGVHLGWSGMAAVDIDPRNLTSDGHEWLCDNIPAFQKTRFIQSGSGGLHGYFLPPPGTDPVRGFSADGETYTTKLEQYPGVEVVGGQHFLVAPLSPHKSGNYYSFAPYPFCMEDYLNDLETRGLPAQRHP